MPRPKKLHTAPPQEGEQAEPTSGKASAPAFVFIGDKNGHGPDAITVHGVTFKKNGDPVEVQSAALAKKLAGNSHFEAA